MKTIVMDTSNAYLVIGLYEDDQCIDKYQADGNRRQSEYALTHLDEMLKKHHWEVLNVDEMIITIGPGSYTGQRVALTIAKTLAAISKIKIKAVSSLHGYAGASKAISVIDARSKKIFVGVYEHNQAIIDDQIMLIDDFANFKEQYPDFQVIGDSDLVGINKVKLDLSDCIYQAGKSVDYCQNIDNLVPHYLKDVEAKKNMLIRRMDLEKNAFSSILILEDNNIIVGYIGMWTLGDQTQITTIGVRKEFQGKGYAKILMTKCDEITKHLGYSNINLEVRVSNTKAISLYQKCGFKIAATRKNYYQDNHEDAYLMVKEMEE